jgi:hypothetical protein
MVTEGSCAEKPILAKDCLTLHFKDCYSGIRVDIRESWVVKEMLHIVKRQRNPRTDS